MSPNNPSLTVTQVLAPCNWAVGQVFELAKAETSIGREIADIDIQHSEISRIHAQIRIANGYSLLTDLGSYNGTFVISRKLGQQRLVARQAQPLETDDEIQIGQTIVFRFTDPKTTFTAITDHVINAKINVVVENHSGRVLVDGQPASTKLNEISRALLVEFLQRPGDVITHDKLKAIGWPDSKPDGVSENAIQQQISAIRAALKSVDATHQYIESVRGSGYRFVPRP